jgi:hypothetical protein
VDVVRFALTSPPEWRLCDELVGGVPAYAPSSLGPAFGRWSGCTGGGCADMSTSSTNDATACRGRSRHVSLERLTSACCRFARPPCCRFARPRCVSLPPAAHLLRHLEMVLQHRQVFLGESLQRRVLAGTGLLLEVRDVLLMVLDHVPRIGRIKRGA